MQNSLTNPQLSYMPAGIATEHFFTTHSASSKAACTDSRFQYAGYVHRELFQKELFQVRAGGPAGTGVWQGSGEAFRESAMRGFTALGGLAAQVFCLACRECSLLFIITIIIIASMSRLDPSQLCCTA